MNLQELEQHIEELEDADDVVSLRSRLKRWSKKAKRNFMPKQQAQRQRESETQSASQRPTERKVTFATDVPVILDGSESRGGTVQRVQSNGPPNDEDKQASLFLQETAHLLSLLSAVAMSTLRNDLEGAESPLATFVPGDPWPCVDPDSYNAEVRKDWTQTKTRMFTVMQYLFGRTRTATSRTLYNAARPFRVIGGVSDAEIHMLQAARGPLAKVALCSMWLQEFISREYLAGSTGGVAPPIISRLYQFISDGMLGYNQARKIAYIPFPFPHAQITSLFILVVVALIPFLMLTFVTNEIFGVALNIVTVMCFTGLHEVSRELENPFTTVPNGELFAFVSFVLSTIRSLLTVFVCEDIPLNNFQAQFNESLLTMYSGYHPDAFWEVKVLEHEMEALKSDKDKLATVRELR